MQNECWHGNSFGFLYLSRQTQHVSNCSNCSILFPENIEMMHILILLSIFQNKYFTIHCSRYEMILRKNFYKRSATKTFLKLFLWNNLKISATTSFLHDFLYASLHQSYSPIAPIYSNFLLYLTVAGFPSKMRNLILMASRNQTKVAENVRLASIFEHKDLQLIKFKQAGDQSPNFVMLLNTF